MNNTNSIVSIIGQRLSSVFQARISTDRQTLVNSFTSGFPLAISSTEYDLAELVFPLGGTRHFLRGCYESRWSNRKQFYLYYSRGVVPTNSISVQAETTAGMLITNNVTDNVTDFQLRITGTSLSSLATVRLVNQDIASVVVNLSPFQSTFTEALRNSSQA